MTDCPTCGGVGFLESPSGNMYDCPECTANAHEVTICTNCGNGYHSLHCPYCDDEEYGPVDEDYEPETRQDNTPQELKDVLAEALAKNTNPRSG